MNDKKIELVVKGIKEIGTRKIEGEKSNPKVLNYFRSIVGLNVDNDEIAWCSAFLNYICKEVGLPTSDSLMARSWLKIGQAINNPEMGDIVIFWRDKIDGPLGHVGIYLASTDKDIFVLGGNQSNEVNVSRFSKSKLLGFRSLCN